MKRKKKIGDWMSLDKVYCDCNFVKSFDLIQRRFLHQSSAILRASQHRWILTIVCPFNPCLATFHDDEVVLGPTFAPTNKPKRVYQKITMEKIRAPDFLIVQRWLDIFLHVVLSFTFFFFHFFSSPTATSLRPGHALPIHLVDHSWVFTFSSRFSPSGKHPCFRKKLHIENVPFFYSSSTIEKSRDLTSCWKKRFFFWT